MKLLIVFTGGTIGCVSGSQYIEVDKKNPFKLIDHYEKKYKADFVYDIVQPYAELSENNTGDTIKKLITCLKEKMKEKYDGIIVTHGTDTLQYTASALGYVFGNNSIPIVMVSANLPIEDERSNALMNFRGAVKFIIKKSGTGVWVSYKNVGETKTMIHRATRLVRSLEFSDSFFSVKNSYFGFWDENEIFHKNESYREYEDNISVMSADGMRDICDFAVWIRPYPGMIYPVIGDKVRYVIFDTYHSGTINTGSKETKSFLTEMKERKIIVFMTGITRGKSYESTKTFGEYNIVPVFDITPVSAYMKLWLAESSGVNPIDVINGHLAGDFIKSRLASESCAPDSSLL